jgi:hypothetical protein
MKKIWILGIALVAAGALCGDTVAIGQLQLSADASGYQDLSFFNLTGSSSGCQVYGSQYAACSGVDITNWALTITFTNENPPSMDPSASYNNTLTSPLVFTSGAPDTIGPYDGANAYIGGSSGTWQLPLNFGNSDEPACGPGPCDYQITQVVFSGTISPADLPIQLGNSATYNSADPSTYTVFNADSTFSTTWMIPGSDYSISSPFFLSDSTDVLVNEQVSISSVPEPVNLRLLCACVLASIILLRGWRSLRRRAAR